jgi:hypothetical protein
MTDKTDTSKAAPAAPPSGAAAATGWLLIIDEGKVVPDTPETRAAYGARVRPATSFETGVAGIITRER